MHSNILLASDCGGIGPDTHGCRFNLHKVCLHLSLSLQINLKNVFRVSIRNWFWKHTRIRTKLQRTLATIESSRGTHQAPFPFLTNKSAVSFEMWMRPGTPLLSMRDAVLTVSPKSWKRPLSPRKTPAVTEPYKERIVWDKSSESRECRRIATIISSTYRMQTNS